MKTLQILLFTVAVGLLLLAGKHAATWTGLTEQHLECFAYCFVMCYEQLAVANSAAVRILGK